MTPMPRSNVRSFVAGFIAATALSGVAMVFPGMRAQLGESPTRTFNADQMIYFYPEWMGRYDLNGNGLPDPFERGIRADTNTAISTMFASLDGDNIPDYCQFSQANADICGVEFSADSGVLSLYRMVPEICDNGIDDEQDSLTDCADSQCSGHPSCTAAAAAVPEVGSKEICDNNVDDDGDAIYDCWDTDDCAGDPACPQAAAPAVNPVRNEVRGAPAVTNSVPVPVTRSVSSVAPAPVFVPIALPTVAPTPVIAPVTPVVTPSSVQPVIPAPVVTPSSAPSAVVPYPLNQYVDPPSSRSPIDDYNVLPTVPTVGQYSFTVCPNTRGDNDGDGVQNALDPACYISTSTSGSTSSPMHGAAGEVCSNRMDDNSNGLVDCGDPLCTGNPACAVDVGPCTDGLDNNRDGFIDGADMGCQAQLGHEGM